MLLGRRRITNEYMAYLQKQLVKWAQTMSCRVQVIIDNTSACKPVVDIINSRYDHIFRPIVQVMCMKKLCETAKDVQAFITNQQHAQDMHRCFEV
jgi:hypothetical protein